MTSAAQLAANAANAQHSTGPVSDAGKAISSQNSLKHGLTAQTVLLPGEDEAAYRKLCADMSDYWRPACEPEFQLVQNLCDTQWRLNRCPRLEADALQKGDFKVLDVISKHEARLKRNHVAILKQLTELASNRQRAIDARMEEAKMVRAADLLKGRPTNLGQIGFVLSTIEEVDAALLRDQVLARAQADLGIHLSRRRM
jgi:hypothetical protein